MSGTRSLRAFLPPLSLEVQPLARLDGGELDPMGAAWPPEGDVLLVLWRPGEALPFDVRRGEVRREGRVWRWGGAPTQAWVVFWCAVGTLGPPAQP